MAEQILMQKRVNFKMKKKRLKTALKGNTGGEVRMLGDRGDGGVSMGICYYLMGKQD